MIKHVLFDFDGTLVDSLDIFVSSWNKIAHQHNLTQIDAKELAVLKKLSLRERIKRLDFSLYKLPIIVPKMYGLYRNSLHKVKLFDGILELLQQLEERGYQTSIISSNSRDNIITFLERNNVTSIDHVLTSSSILGKDKLINRFLKENKLKPSEVIYVGDEQRDILACKKTGIKVIWVSWGYDSLEIIDVENPDFKVFAPEEILEII